jgi:hypothetical protein
MSTNREAMQNLIAEWIKMRNWAANLLMYKLVLDSPREILRPENRGRKPIPDSDWVYRTHGIGVDVTQCDGLGGIDFDFAHETEFAPPDPWRLQLFAQRALRAGKLSREIYEPLLADQSAFNALADEVLKVHA